jgi:hypothetical protein
MTRLNRALKRFAQWAHDKREEQAQRTNEAKYRIVPYKGLGCVAFVKHPNGAMAALDENAVNGPGADLALHIDLSAKARGLPLLYACPEPEATRRIYQHRRENNS